MPSHVYVPLEPRAVDCRPPSAPQDARIPSVVDDRDVEGPDPPDHSTPFLSWDSCLHSINGICDPQKHPRTKQDWAPHIGPKPIQPGLPHPEHRGASPKQASTQFQNTSHRVALVMVYASSSDNTPSTSGSVRSYRSEWCHIRASIGADVVSFTNELPPFLRATSSTSQA